MRQFLTTALVVALSGCQIWAPDAFVFDHIDRDDDGYAAIQAGGQDCDDSRVGVHPQAEEICDDGIDNNCDGVVDDFGRGSITWYIDNDGDGWGTEVESRTACADWLTNKGWSTRLGDCDDGRAGINPDVDDGDCDGDDENCSGVADEQSDFRTLYFDGDGDSYGVNTTTISDCTNQELTDYATRDGDCDDTDATINPGRADENCNGVDEDCDFVADDDHPEAGTLWYVDFDGDGYGDANDLGPTEVCPAQAPGGTVDDNSDCDDSNAQVNPGTVEECDDGIDNDCNMQVDAADPGLEYRDWYVDLDGDSFGDPLGPSVYACARPAPATSLNSLDCNDDDAQVYPTAPERCNGFDDDCDTVADEGLMLESWWPDVDGDSFGDETVAALEVCDGAQPVDFVDNNADCNDAVGYINPVANDICNGMDDDCDGLDDDDAVFKDWLPDSDGDGYGQAIAPVNQCAEELGTPQNGGDWIEWMAGDPLDCNDQNEFINPGATEVCDGEDNDCAGGVDDGLTVYSWYIDADTDGSGAYGSAPESVSCDGLQDPTTVSNDDDCDDGDPAVDMYLWAPDIDRDGYRVDNPIALTHLQCPDPTTGLIVYAWQPGDCDNGNAMVNPGAEEVCNDGIDNSCNPSDECWLSGDDPLAPGELTVPADALTTVSPFNLAFDPLEADAFGTALTSLPDQNGDGVDEVVVGAPHRGVSGEVYVLQSPFAETRTTTSSIKFTGATAAQRLGATVLGVPDITGDSDHDLVIGEPYASTLSSGAEIHILEGPVLSGGVVDFSAAIHLYGEPDDRLGSAIGLLPAPGLGCLRALLVGSARSDVSTDGVYVVCRPVIASEPIRARADFIINALMPQVVSSAGDQTGDGFHEVMVGYLNASTFDWEVSVVDLSLALGTVADVGNISVATFQTGTSNSATSAAFADVDGDGVDDLAIGVPSGAGGSGEVYLLRGPVTGLLGTLGSAASLVIQGVQAGDAIGGSVGLEDVNGDGLPDLLIGGNGVAYVHRGPIEMSGTVSADMLETTVGRAGTGPSVVAGGADLDGDGYGDFVIGAPEYLTRGQVFGVRGLGL